MKNIRLLVFSLLMAFMMIPGKTAAGQDSVSLTPVKDNTLFESATGALSNGAGLHLFAGRTGPRNAGLVRRAVLAFDLASALPAGAVIDSVRLTMRMNRTIGDARVVSVHRVLADWGEGTSVATGNEGRGITPSMGDATWIHTFFNTGSWQFAGGDFDEESASLLIGSEASYTWYSTFGLIADVNRWISTPSENFGWLLLGDETVNTTAKRFASRENGDQSARPQLQIYFSIATDIEIEAIPTSVHLRPTYPNPFLWTTTIEYRLDTAQHISLKVYDSLGREITTLVASWQVAGSHKATFDASNLPAGVYLFRLIGDDFDQIGKMIALK